MAVQEDETETAFLRTVEETCSDLPLTEGEDASPRAEEDAPKKPETLTDKLGKIAESEGFRVDQMLGKGGMGAVMLATDRAIGRKVALKFLALPDMADQKALDSLRQEASRVGGLSHENIVQLYSWHSVGRLTFFAMEYVDGDNMQQLVQRETRMRPEKILRIMAEATSGVAAAHEQNIIHRDIKPANIIDRKSVV